MTKRLVLFSGSLIALALLTFSMNSFAKTEGLLSEEEELWLKSRNNTIVVYPEKGFPPFSYQATSGFPQGLSMDYLELIAEKTGIKIEYLPARPLYQILEDIKNGKGDLVTSLSSTPSREEFLYFTDTYVSVPSVIVVRKDFNEKNILNVSDLTGKKVAVGEGYAVAEFLNKNYPRIILERVTDDEVGLQKVVLGEVDVAVMDIASLSFYLSKQVLSSVKVVGGVGYDYKLAFAVPKDKQILQSIIDKGLTQISKNDRELLNDKWVSVPHPVKTDSLYDTVLKSINRENMYMALIFALIVVLVLVLKRGSIHSHFFKRKQNLESLKEEIEELGEMNTMLSEELNKVKEQENKLKEKLHTIE